MNRHGACVHRPPFDVSVLSFVCVVALGLGAPALAREICVSPAGRDDGGNGSAAAPYREIRQAVAAVRPGDTILIADGDYKGFEVRDLHASSNAPIVLRAAGRNARILPTTDRRDNRDTIYLDGCRWITLDGLRAFDGLRAGVRIEGSDHITVRNGVFGNNDRWGIFTGHCDDLLIENNECFGSRKEHGIYVGNSGDRPVIRGNRSHDNRGCGIHLNADLSCGGDGIITGALIENNVVYGNGGGGGAGINMDGVQDSTIRNNLLYGNHASGITSFKIDGAAGPKGQRILNNTIVMASNARYALQFGQTLGTNWVRNNILYDLNPIRGGLAFNEARDVRNVDSGFNVFSTEAPIVATDDWAVRVSLTKWQAKGMESHSLVAALAVLFADPANNDYRLKAASPAIDTGQNLPEVPRDLTGAARPAGRSTDIGCYESPATGR